jgi:hypothetical protein
MLMTGSPCVRAVAVEEIAMRFLVAAVAVCACMIAPIAGLAAGPAAPAGSAADVPAAGAPTAADTAAAAKHEKRTACRKQAKAKRLVGAEKASFLKSCVAAK